MISIIKINNINYKGNCSPIHGPITREVGERKVFENMKGKLVWDFEYKLRQSSSARRPDLTL